MFSDSFLSVGYADINTGNNDEHGRWFVSLLVLSDAFSQLSFPVNTNCNIHFYVKSWISQISLDFDGEANISFAGWGS